VPSGGNIKILTRNHKNPPPEIQKESSSGSIKINQTASSLLYLLSIGKLLLCWTVTLLPLLSTPLQERIFYLRL